MIETVYYDSRSLESSWQLLPNGPDYVEEHESWQYMGSTFDRHTGEALHCFRHRCLNGQRKYVKIIENDLGVRIAEG